MTAIPGVFITKNKKGQITHVNIDVRKHQEALPALEQLGLIPKTQFDIDFEDGYTLDELESYLTNIVKKHYADKSKTAGA